MEFDNLHLFNTELSFYLTKFKHPCPLIRKHKGICGDFSFPLTFKYWIKYLYSDETIKNFQVTSSTILDHSYYNKEYRLPEEKSHCDDHRHLWVLDHIVACSKSWPLVVSKCMLQRDRIQIHLDRKITFQTILEIILSKKSTYGHYLPKQKIIAVTSNVMQHDKNEMDLSKLRIELVRNTTANLLEAAGFKVCDTCNKSCTCLHFTNKSTDQMETNCQKVVCGVVINTKHHSKESHMKATEYIRQRCEDMQVLAKNRCRNMNLEHTTQWEDFVLQLGDAAVKMDLLHVKPSHTVSLNIDPDNTGYRETSSRGAAFALYNCARLSEILRQFEERVESGYYPPLIPFEQVNFSLLSREEEWELLFVHLLCYPSVLESCVHNVEQGKVSPNLMCKFVMDMTSSFSLYYRRVHILTEARSHILPVMFARLHLLQAIQQVLHNALGNLGISPVLSM